MSSGERPWVAVGVLTRESVGEGLVRDPRGEPAEAAGLDLDAGLLHLARELATLAPAPDREPMRLLAAAVLAAERAGSTRVPRAEVAALATAVACGDATAGAAAASLLARAEAGDPALAHLFGGEEDYRPLLLADGCLYAQRLWELERRAAGNLRALLGAPEREAPELRDPERVAAALADVRARPPLDARGRPLALSAEQESAVALALGGRLAAVTGGPGSGKTWIVATLLRVLARLGDPQLSAVALAAPTGKAADRLQGSIAASLAAIADPAPADRDLMAALPPAVTLHRLLSYSPSGERFRHHERNPLAERLVIVDESSMIDLPLFDHLLRSLPAGGSLVLLGDARQLPSVEAGAAFRDLVESPAAASRVSRLTRSWRMDPADPAGSAILALAGRIAMGDLGELPEVLTPRAAAAELRFEGAELLSVGRQALSPFLERWWSGQVLALPRYPDLVGCRWLALEGEIRGEPAAELAGLFDHLASFRLLSPHRGWAGGAGAAAMNAWFRSRLAAEAGIEAGGDVLLPGEPVLVTRNDYSRGLYNGDQGLVLAVEVDGRAVPMAVFRTPAGAFRVVPLAALEGRLEPAWASTVHKAQGSEHATVALVLPAEPGRLLTRELVYTALTRARRSVVVVGDETVLRAAAGRAVERWSGVGARLAPAASPTPHPLPGEQLGLPFG